MAFVHFDSEQVVEVQESQQEVNDLVIGAGVAYTPMIQATLAHEGETVLLDAHRICVVSDGPAPSRVPLS